MLWYDPIELQTIAGQCSCCACLCLQDAYRAWCMHIADAVGCRGPHLNVGSDAKKVLQHGEEHMLHVANRRGHGRICAASEVHCMLIAMSLRWSHEQAWQCCLQHKGSLTRRLKLKAAKLCWHCTARDLAHATAMMCGQPSKDSVTATCPLMPLHLVSQRFSILGTPVQEGHSCLLCQYLHSADRH